MSYQITEECIQCNRCMSLCPTGAIKKDETHFWIVSEMCNNCAGHYSTPQCAAVCPTNYGCVSEQFDLSKQQEELSSKDYWERWFNTYAKKWSKQVAHH
ncbi:MAG: hypothetical protein Tsb0014_14710 [Pleurocapsa sp.]